MDKPSFPSYRVCEELDPVCLAYNQAVLTQYVADLADWQRQNNYDDTAYLLNGVRTSILQSTYDMVNDAMDNINRNLSTVFTMVYSLNDSVMDIMTDIENLTLDLDTGIESILTDVQLSVWSINDYLASQMGGVEQRLKSTMESETGWILRRLNDISDDISNIEITANTDYTELISELQSIIEESAYNNLQHFDSQLMNISTLVVNNSENLTARFIEAENNITEAVQYSISSIEDTLSDTTAHNDVVLTELVQVIFDFVISEFTVSVEDLTDTYMKQYIAQNNAMLALKDTEQGG